MEFPFGLYYSHDGTSLMKNCKELASITVKVPKEYQNLGRKNRFRILMTFSVAEISFSVVHLQSGIKRECSVYLS